MISGSLLREARLRGGLTQVELAHSAGVAASAIGRWERGEARPSLERLIELIRHAGFDLVYSLAPADSHDRTLIRRSLAQSPADRLGELVVAVRAFDRMAAAARS